MNKFSLKQLFAAFLTLALTASVLGVYASEIYTQKDMETFNNNISLLRNLDLVEINERDAATTVKRGDFTDIMLKYMGVDRVEYSGEMFSDVPDRTDSVYIMVEMGIMSGYSNGTFAPDKDLLFDEAVKALVSMLGGDEPAKQLGGYPAGYVSVAERTGLLKRTTLSHGMPVTYFDLVQMLVDALSADERYLGEFYFTSPGYVWLFSHLDIEEKKGIVTATPRAALNGSPVRENTVEIDNVLYDCKDDYSELLGSRVKFYINGDDEVIYAAEYETERQVFDASAVEEYSNKTYRIYKTENSDRTTNFRLAQDVSILYNGAPASDISAEEMVPEYGSVTLISNEGGSQYDVVLIESYDIYTVDTIDREGRRIVSKNYRNSVNVIDFHDMSDEDITIENAVGNKVDFERISENAVIRVGFSKNREKLKIIVSTKSVMGKISEIGEKNGDMLITVEGEQYRTTSDFALGMNYNIGSGGIFYLDVNDLIAWYIPDDKEWAYGYLKSAAVSEEITETLYLRVYDSAGNHLRLECADKINIDGLKRQSAKQAYDLLKKGTNEIVKQMIRFKYNSDGLVKEIDTPYNSVEDMDARPQNGESPDSLRLIYAKTNAHYSKPLYSFGGMLNVARNTPIFNITSDKERDYSIHSVADLANDTRYNIEAYSDSENERCPKFLFMSSSLGGSGQVLVGVVTKAKMEIDPEEEINLKLSLETYTGHMELFCEDGVAEGANENETYSIEIGDIVSFTYKGEFTDNVTMLFKRKSEKLPRATNNVFGTFGASKTHYIYGTAYSKEQNYLNITTADLSTGKAPAADRIESGYFPVFKAFKFSDASGKSSVTPATLADVMVYKSAGGDASKVFMATDWQSPRIIVIY